MGARIPSKRIGKTEYKYVAEFRNQHMNTTFYQAFKTINGKSFSVWNKTAKGAALALDKKLIESGLEPINILKKISV